VNLVSWQPAGGTAAPDRASVRCDAPEPLERQRQGFHCGENIGRRISVVPIAGCEDVRLAGRKRDCMRMVLIKRSAVVCVLAGLVAVIGCGHPVDEEAAIREQYGLKDLAILYSQFRARNRGRAAPNEDVLKKFILQQDKGYLQQLGVTNVDDLFVSPRDKKPYVVFYGQANLPVYEGHQIVAYEQEGVNGTRLVATALGAIMELDEQTFQQVVGSQSPK